MLSFKKTMWLCLSIAVIAGIVNAFLAFNGAGVDRILYGVMAALCAVCTIAIACNIRWNRVPVPRGRR